MSIRAVLRYFRGEWLTLAATTGISIVGALFDALSVVMIVGLADAVSREEGRLDRSVGPFSISLSHGAAALVAITAVAASVLAVVAVSQLRARSVTRWTMAKRLELIEAFIDADWSLQSRDRVGALQTDLSYATYASFLLGGLINAARGAIGLAILIGAAFVFNVVAASLVLVLGAVISLVLRPVNRAVKRRSAMSAAQTKRLNEQVAELTHLARDIRVFGVQDTFRQRFVAPVTELGASERRTAFLSSLPTPIYQAMAMTLIIAGLYASSRLTSIEPGLLGIIALLMLRSVSYGQQLQTAVTTLHQAAPALDIIDTSLERLRTRERSFGEDRLTEVSSISLDRLEFAYDDGEPVLKRISSEFRQGEIVGLIGRSGSGKSTLAQLLLRLRSGQGGTVRVNGQPAEQFAPSAWSRAISFVPQEPQLMYGTIHDNIAFLRSWLTRSDVIAAAVAAGIHDTITELPHGYDTVVGQGARDLSGGQRQRLGIARALAGHPSVIVLDEPTSALDQQSEAIIQETLSRIRGEALIIVIAHRLTTLAICDRVVLLEDGIIERECPPELISGVVAESALGEPSGASTSHPVAQSDDAGHTAEPQTTRG